MIPFSFSWFELKIIMWSDTDGYSAGTAAARTNKKLITNSRLLLWWKKKRRKKSGRTESTMTMDDDDMSQSRLVVYRVVRADRDATASRVYHMTSLEISTRTEPWYEID